MEERRNLPRWPMNSPFLGKVLGEEAAVFSGSLRDINLVGAKVHLNVPLALQTRLGLEIELPAQEIPLCLEGEVIWQKAQGAEFPTGIRFTRFKPADKERILSYFSSHIQKTWWQRGAAR